MARLQIVIPRLVGPSLRHDKSDAAAMLQPLAARGGGAVCGVRAILLPRMRHGARAHGDLRPLSAAEGGGHAIRSFNMAQDDQGWMRRGGCAGALGDVLLVGAIAAADPG